MASASTSMRASPTTWRLGWPPPRKGSPERIGQGRVSHKSWPGPRLREPMSDLQVLAAAAAAALSIIAAIIAVVGAGRGGRADALASFAPFSLCLALAGALLAWLGFGPGSATAVLLGLNGVVAALCLARLAPELMRLRPALRRDRPALRILSGNLYWTNPSAGDAVATIL